MSFSGFRRSRRLDDDFDFEGTFPTYKRGRRTSDPWRTTSPPRRKRSRSRSERDVSPYQTPSDYRGTQKRLYGRTFTKTNQWPSAISIADSHYQGLKKSSRAEESSYKGLRSRLEEREKNYTFAPSQWHEGEHVTRHFANHNGTSIYKPDHHRQLRELSDRHESKAYEHASARNDFAKRYPYVSERSSSSRMHHNLRKLAWGVHKDSLDDYNTHWDSKYDRDWRRSSF